MRLVVMRRRNGVDEDNGFNTKERRRTKTHEEVRHVDVSTVAPRFARAC